MFNSKSAFDCVGFCTHHRALSVVWVVQAELRDDDDCICKRVGGRLQLAASGGLKACSHTGLCPALKPFYRFIFYKFWD